MLDTPTSPKGIGIYFMDNTYSPSEYSMIREMKRLRKVCAELRCDNEEIVAHVFWFIYNWPADFIEQCWGSNPMLQEHLHDKFMGYYSKAPNPHSAMLQFYWELDEKGKAILIDYILSLPKSQ
ncbi:MAG: hypothetical protein WCW62_06980 [Bacteroidales bacterium]